MFIRNQNERDDKEAVKAVNEKKNEFQEETEAIRQDTAAMSHEHQQQEKNAAIVASAAARKGVTAAIDEDDVEKTQLHVRPV